MPDDFATDAPAERRDDAQQLLREFAQVSANLINAAYPRHLDEHVIPSMYVAALGSLANRAARALAAAAQAAPDR